MKSLNTTVPPEPVSRRERQALDLIKLAWATYAPLLAEWVLALAVRVDLHLRYRLFLADKGTAGVEPEVRATTVYEPLTTTALVQHFRATDYSAICGFAVTSPDEMCRLVVLDFDAHGPDDDPEANFRMALAVYKEARQSGLDCLLLDSDGRGGLHLYAILPRVILMAVAWRLGKWLARNYRSYGLKKPPESFPNAAQLSGKRVGRFIRIPGRHPKRDHWTRVWCPATCRWLEGGEAILAILQHTGSDVDPAQIVPAAFEPEQLDNSVKTRCAPPAPRVPVAPEPTTGRRSQIADFIEHAEHVFHCELAERALAWLKEPFWDDYDCWIKVGMALKQLGDDGLRLWHEWSRASRKYDAAVLDQKWETFGDRLGGVTLGTLFMWAKQEGWPGTL